MAGTGRGGAGFGLLTAREARAARDLISLVRKHVPAELEYALLFGSKARGSARPDSDIDVLLIFRELPVDREPQASIAEDIAHGVAEYYGVPVEPWSVALIDLQRGMRTPMLVDALADGVPLWPPHRSSPCLPFTPQDALRCTGALLDRVREGSEEVASRWEWGDAEGAVRRARDDLVRLCTGALLLHGETRPRRRDSIRRFVQEYVVTGAFPIRYLPVFRWAAESYTPDGKEGAAPLLSPPGGLARVSDVVSVLRDRLADARDDLSFRAGESGTPGAPAG
ncbi:hypothetical protein BH23GEM3_BH23GEM3_21490 [soil metagenome]|nr:nucleotidyltransferase domain-containing protein [Gemmatimonadota bacterium]